MRVGNGFDVHRLVTDRPLILGGVNIPFEFGLEGHSDADVLAHAITDALLGAAALGDIGMWFPHDRGEWRGADSMEFLRTAASAISQRNYQIVNVDSIIICEQPKLSPYFPQMRALLAENIGISVKQVSVKATTSEGLGFVGRGEAVAAQAVVLIDEIK